ncbi:MAG: hypothetical protein EHM36_03830 [Deltaproteobacteria bacterium]|nr:MAG: hypothetical protein EHM36_03830 [Deltaproteobacteria bacterium]
MSAVEMTCAGRSFKELGKKLLNLQPLSQQLVDPADSVLGGLSLSPSNGLNTDYKTLIRTAFRPIWWRSPTLVNGYTVMENNFSLFWGISIMLYERTLVSDDTHFDQYLRGNKNALTDQQKKGLSVFRGKGQCTKCHDKAELSDATVSNAKGNPLVGFHNIGVRPETEDGGDILQPGKGFFKTPQLRNVELNGPYFHNGHAATLRQVVDFYDRGGDFPSALTNIKPLGLKASEKNDLVAFLLSLTDERVRFERAPFDHPSMFVPNFGTLPAVGAAGRATPLRTFMGLNPFSP